MWLILSHFLPFTKAFEPFVNTFSAHGFPLIHLPQHFMRLRCSFPEFIAELHICTLLHCAVTLPLTLTMFSWLQSVYSASHMQSVQCVDSPHVSEEPCTCSKLLFKYDTIHQTIRHPVYFNGLRSGMPPPKRSYDMSSHEALLLSYCELK